MPYTIENNRRVAYTEVIKGKTKREIDKMGMSASQVRFLSLQHRKHNIGTQLTALSNRKMALSRDMNKVSKDYTNKLNQSILKWSNDSGVNYHKLNYDLMMSPNEVNATLPYIVTDRATGRVVLNNDEITDFEGNGLGLSYVDIAEMISNFESMDSYSNIINRSGAVTTSPDGVVTGAKAVDNAYYIPEATRDYNFDNNLRYVIFEKLGLITPQQKVDQISLLTELYGSPEAKATGVYPVGSAWGDYYVALANLQAYADFKNTEHTISTANTYDSSARTSGNYKTASADYGYNEHVNGSGDAYSQVTQEASESHKTDRDGALAHIDFEAVTYINSSGVAQTAFKNSASDTAEYNARINATDTYTTGADLSGILTNVTISRSSAGLTYNYQIQDITQSALDATNYTSGSIFNFTDWLHDPNTESKSDEKTDVGAGNANGSRLLVLDNHRGSNSDWSHSDNIWSDRMSGSVTVTQATLSTACDNFKALLLSNEVTNLNSTALDNAKNATVNLFMNHVSGGSYHCWYTNSWEDVANSHMIQNDYMTGHPHIDWFDISWHPSGDITSVDLRSVFNVYMSYYNAYVQDPSLSSVPFDPSKYVASEIIPYVSTVSGTEMSSHGKPETRSDGTNTYYYSWVIGSPNSGTNKMEIIKLTKSTSNAKYEFEPDGTIATDPKKYKGLCVYSYYDYAAGPIGTRPDGTPIYGTKTATLTDSSARNRWYDDSSSTGYPSNKAALAAMIGKSESDISSFYFEQWYESTDEDMLTYSGGVSGGNPYVGSPMTINIDFDHQNVNVYGTLVRGNDTYYFTDKSVLETYMTTGQLPSTTNDINSCYKYNSSNVSTSVAFPVTWNDTDPNPNNHVEINQAVSSTKYDIKVDGKINEDTGYQAALERKVAEAQDRISNLEDMLDDFYAGADKKMMDFYDALFMRIAQNGWMVDDKTAANATGNNSVSSGNQYHAEYLNNKLQNNDYFVTVCEEKGDKNGFNYITKQATSVMKIFKVRDEDAENTALAEYEAAKTLISSKEKKIDARMQKLETEQEAITTELQSVKKVINENIDKTFKIFA